MLAVAVVSATGRGERLAEEDGDTSRLEAVIDLSAIRYPPSASF
jgi:hypothetical protein